MPVLAPLPSSTALVAIVVPWNTAATSDAVVSAIRKIFSTPAKKPSAGSLGVDGVLVVHSAPPAPSIITTSVNVPPMSNASRSCAIPLLGVSPGAVSLDAAAPILRKRGMGGKPCGAAAGQIDGGEPLPVRSILRDGASRLVSMRLFIGGPTTTALMARSGAKPRVSNHGRRAPMVARRRRRIRGSANENLPQMRLVAARGKVSDGRRR